MQHAKRTTDRWVNINIRTHISIKLATTYEYVIVNLKKRISRARTLRFGSLKRHQNHRWNHWFGCMLYNLFKCGSEYLNSHWLWLSIVSNGIIFEIRSHHNKSKTGGWHDFQSIGCLCVFETHTLKAMKRHTKPDTQDEIHNEIERLLYCRRNMKHENEKNAIMRQTIWEMKWTQRTKTNKQKMSRNEKNVEISKQRRKLKPSHNFSCDARFFSQKVQLI